MKKNSFIFALISVCLLSSFAWAGGYTVQGVSGEFKFRTDITIDETKVDADLTDFPVLVKLTSSNFNFNYLEDSTGARIRFTASIDAFGNGTGTLLKYERERFDATNQVAEIWVKVPSVSSTSNTTFYMFYGNSTAIGDGQDAANVWDSSFQAVWHLKEQPSGAADEIKESTSNVRHGTTVGGMTSANQVAGQINGSLNFDNLNDRIDTKDFMSGLSAMTAEAWVYKADDTGDDRIVAKTNTVTSTSTEYIFSLGVTLLTPRVRLATGGAGGFGYDGEQAISLNTWTHVAFTYDGSYIRIYKNAQNIGTYSKSGAVNSLAQIVVIANNDNIPNDRYWNGKLDEIRLSNIARSTGWLLTEYNNQSSPSTFYSVGSEQTVVELAYFRAKGQKQAVLLEWETRSEIDNEGFNILRSEGGNGGYVQINPALLPSKGQGGYGASYSYRDEYVLNSVTYFYLLEDVDCYGRRSVSGPVSATPHDIQLIWPEDGQLLAVDAYLFCWRSANFSSFKVDLSFSESFLDSNTVSFPSDSWTADQYLCFSLDVLVRLARRAEVSGGAIYWRVRARLSDGPEVCSETRKLRFINRNAPEMIEKRKKDIKGMKDRPPKK